MVVVSCAVRFSSFWGGEEGKLEMVGRAGYCILRNWTSSSSSSSFFAVGGIIIVLLLLLSLSLLL